MLIYLLMLDSDEEKDKFSALYKNYRYTMLYVALAIVHDQAMAEDVVHNAFLKIIEILDKFDEIKSSKAKNLIVTIVKNKAIDLMRREKRMDYLPPEELDGFSTADTDEPAEYVFNRQGYDTLLACISGLNDRYKTILELKYFQELSNQEIAELLAINLKNAEIRLYRAKKKLREALVKEETASGR